MNNDGNRSRSILVGVVVVIIVILIVIFFVRRSQNENSNLVNSNIPFPQATSAFESQLQNNFGITVPSSAVKANLVDVTGGNQMGLATFDKQSLPDGKLSGQNDYTVIANLEDPATGYFYEAWLANNTDVIPLGQLNIAKGGWLLDYTTPKDLTDHKKVWITLESVNDNTPEKHILEGSF